MTEQLHECSDCGLANIGQAHCPDCDGVAFPMWSVYTLKGRCVGIVHGFSERDACETIVQTPQFDRYLSLQPRPCMRSTKQGHV